MLQRYFKKIAITMMAALSIVGLNTPASHGEGIGFTDVQKDFWGYSSIVWASDQGIVDGYPDGSFKPDQPVTQIEFLAMLVRAYVKHDLLPTGDSNFWGTPYFRYGVNMGWGGSIVFPPSSKLIDDSYYNVPATRAFAAKLITNTSGRNYSIDDSIRFLLDRGIAEGIVGKSVEGFKGYDFLTRAQSILFIENLKSMQDILYPSPTKENAYDPSTLKKDVIKTFPLYVNQPSNDTAERFTKVAVTAPTAGYSLVHVPFYNVEAAIDQAIGDALTIHVEYWDSGLFTDARNIKAPISNGKLSVKIDLPKLGIYRVTILSDYEKDGKKMDQNMALTTFFIENHVEVNENIMSNDKRNSLNDDQQEMIAFLDEYVYYHNLHSENGSNKVPAIDGLDASFGKNFISIKALDVPKYLDERNISASMRANVSLKVNLSDDKPYIDSNCLLEFSLQDGHWKLGYIFRDEG
jgi:hypothetical protein